MDATYLWQPAGQPVRLHRMPLATQKGSSRLLRCPRFPKLSSPQLNIPEAYFARAAQQSRDEWREVAALVVPPKRRNPTHRGTDASQSGQRVNETPEDSGAGAHGPA